MTDVYLDLLTTYHAPAMKIDPLYAVEWSFIPQFYTSFYSFQYATSITAAAVFAAGIRSGSGAVLVRYLDLLKAGGSSHGYDLVCRAGVDLATSEPYRALQQRFSDLLDEGERLL